MNRYISIIVLIIAAVLQSCDDNSISQLYMIGDSIIARWDADESLNMAVTHNLGVSGSGIAYVEQLAGTQKEHDVVMICGTNDLGAVYLGETTAAEYAIRYINAIENLDAHKVYLFSILPRDFNNQPDYNGTIRAMNEAIQERITNNNSSNIVYLDVFDRFMDGDHIDYELYSDGLHLSPQGYEILSSELRKHL